MPEIINTEKNNLFPVFLKLEQLRVLLIGGGKIAFEKLNALINNSPSAKIRIVAKEVSAEFKNLALQYTNVEIVTASYKSSLLDDCDIVITAVNDIELSKIIKDDSQKKGKLINVADKPELCDFYLGSVVTKGNLKIAISTNGKSPTIAKRLKEVFNELLPDELEYVLDNMEQIRKSISGDFTNKVQQLNDITKLLVEKQKAAEDYEQYWFL